jgi:hypothetical protein
MWGAFDGLQILYFSTVNIKGYRISNLLIFALVDSLLTQLIKNYAEQGRVVIFEILTAM